VVPGVVHRTGNRSTYTLVLQHQPKVRPETAQVRLTLPRGAFAIHADGFERDGQRLVWAKKLTRDTELEVSWRS
jgi:hypothetical protein